MGISELTPATLLILGIVAGMVLFLWALVGREFKAGPFRLPRITGKPQRMIVGFMGGGIAAVCLFLTLYTPLGILYTKPPTTLTVLVGLSSEELEVFEEITQQFESKHNVTVKVENVTKDEALRKLKEEEIDVITFDINDRIELARTGLIEELTEEEYKGLPPATAHPTLQKYLKVDGIRYFMPYRPNVRLVFLNRAKFAEMGLDYPTTWQDVLEVAKRFYERDGEARVVLQAKGDAYKTAGLIVLIRSAGGDLLNLLHPQSREALEFLRELWPFVSPKSLEADYQTTTGLLLADSVYLARNWAFSVALIEKAGRDADFETYAGWCWSQTQKLSHYLGGEILVLPKNAPNKELAIKFVRHLMSDEVQETFVRQLSWPTMRLDLDVTKLQPWQRRHLRVMNDVLNHGEPTPDYWQPELTKIYSELFNEVTNLGQDASMEFTLERFQAEIDALGIRESK